MTRLHPFGARPDKGFENQSVDKSVVPGAIPTKFHHEMSLVLIATIPRS
jgi:hypothetical protein